MAATCISLSPTDVLRVKYCIILRYAPLRTKIDKRTAIFATRKLLATNDHQGTMRFLHRNERETLAGTQELQGNPEFISQYDS